MAEELAEGLIRPHPPEVKKYAEFKPAYDAVYATLTAGQAAGIFKKDTATWLEDAGPNLTEATRSKLNDALAQRAKKIEASVATLSRFEKAVEDKTIIVENGKVITTEGRAAEALVQETAESYPDAIAGLELIIADTAGKSDADSIALNTQATGALEGIKHNISVTLTTHKQQSSEEPFLTRANDIDKRAKALWIKDSGQGIDDAKLTEEYNILPPLVKAAYRELADEERFNEVEKVDYKLIYAPEKPVDNPPTEDEARDNAPKIADALIKEITEIARQEYLEQKKAGEVNMKGDTTFSWLTFLNRRLKAAIKGDASPGIIQMLSSEITSAADACFLTHPGLAQNPNIKNARTLLERNKSFYNDPGNDPARNFLTSRAKARAYSMDPETINAGNIFNATTILGQAAVEDQRDFSERRQRGVASRVSQIITKLSQAGMINGYEEGWLRHLDAHTNETESAIIAERDLLAGQLGITPVEMTDIFSFSPDGTFGLSNYLITSVPQIAKTIYDPFLIPDDAEEALRHRFKFLLGDINKKEKGGFWTMNKTIGLMLMIQLSQGILDFSGDDPDRQQQAHQ